MKPLRIFVSVNILSNFLDKRTKSFHDAFEGRDKDLLLVSDSVESLTNENEEFAYRGRTVHIAIVSDKYTLLEEVDHDSHRLSCEKLPLENPQDGSNALHDEEALLQHEKKKTLKEHLAKKWRGKKAKRFRKVSNRKSLH